MKDCLLPVVLRKKVWCRRVGSHRLFHSNPCDKISLLYCFGSMIWKTNPHIEYIVGVVPGREIAGCAMKPNN